MISYKNLLSGKNAMAVVGLGYVGLPLAVELGKKFDLIGFEVSKERLKLLKKNVDPSNELSSKDLEKTKIKYTDDSKKLKRAKFVIVAVPTPIDSANNPDLSVLKSACKIVGKNLSKGTIVVFESTVYPGVTDDICAPELEKYSGLKRGVDFKLGYSPERINPGDTKHTLKNVIKVVSGEDKETLDTVSKVYETVVKVGVHRAKNIKVAEAAKVIENTQRDLNIALMNELSVIFDKMDIDTKEVLLAAGTKWNFLEFTPGLVGGHCIGVDPYYLTHRAKEMGYNPEVILAGRHINDKMGKNVAEKTVKLMIHNGCTIKGAKVLVLGLAFKENVSDIRNTRVIDIVNELKSFGVDVIVSDSVIDKADAKRMYGIEVTDINNISDVSAVICATSHDIYKKMSPKDILKLHKDKSILIDVRRIFNREVFEQNGVVYWGL